MSPPRLPLRLLELLLPDHARDEVLGDLHEEWLNVSRTRGTLLGWLWYTCLALALAARYAIHGPWIQGLALDLAAAWRSWRKQPLAAAVIIITFALAIGANAAVLSVVKAVLLTPFGVTDAERLILLAESNASQGAEFLYVPGRTFAAWRDESTTFDAMAPATWARFGLTGQGEPTEVIGARVSADYFRVAGMVPQLGRTFTEEEDTPGAPQPVVILGEGLWKRAFGANPHIVGSAIRLNGEAHTIVGVMPYSFGTRYAGWGELWTPLGLDIEREIAAGFRRLVPAGRLKPGVSIEQARADLNVISRRPADQLPREHKGFGATAMSVPEYVLRDVRPFLQLLWASAGVLLVVACANIGGLLAARGLAQQRMTAIRTALGATRFRLFRYGFVEALLVIAVGTSLGLLLARTALPLILSAAPEGVPRLNEATVDPLVALANVVLAFVATIAIGFVPAMAVLRADVETVLRAQTHRSTGSALHARLRNTLVVVQIAACVVLLIGGGLLLRGVQALLSVNPGFDAENVVSATISHPTNIFPTPDTIVRFHQSLVGQLERVPGVTSAATVSFLPMHGGQIGRAVYIEGRPIPEPGAETRAFVQATSRAYFDTLRVPLLDGRVFSERESWELGGVALVSQLFADREWPSEPALGKAVSIRDPRRGAPEWLTVIGVVVDARVSSGGLESPPDASMYVPVRALPAPSMSVVVRAAQDATSLSSAVRGEIRRLSPDTPVSAIVPLATDVRRSAARPTFAAGLLGVFACVSLLLAATGLYGLVSQSVSQRLAEFGVRFALGATGRDILGLVGRQAASLVFAGTVAGVAIALAVSRPLADLLFEVHPRDPIVYATVLLVLIGVSATAVLVPAIKAMRVDPVDAIRNE